MVLAVFSLLGFTMPALALAAGPALVNLGTAGNFRILAQTAVTDANPSISSIVGNVGVSPAAGSTITGLSCSGVTGNIYDVDGTYTGGYNSNIACLLPGPGANKTTVDNAVGDMGTAYTNASAPATPAGVGVSNLNVGGGTLSGQNFVPGVYTWGSNVSITGDITITGSASDVWVFQVTGTLTVANNKKIILAGGALPANIFWQVTSAVTLQPGSDFSGNILSHTNIALQAGATLHGRALAQTAVTLIGNTISGTTPPIVTIPTVVTNAVSSVDPTDATLNGAISSTGGSDATQSGFAYGTDPTLTAGTATSTLGAQTGDASFLQNLTGLSPSTTYYDRAYATNSAGDGLGTIQSFTTSSTPPPAPVVSGMSSGRSSGGSSSVYDPNSTTVPATTVTTVVTTNPTAIVPTLPNTGFPPETTNIFWDYVICAGALALVVVSSVVALKKRS